jgi:hypothetical protein
MRILLPERKKQVELQVGDLMKSPYDNEEVYILSRLDNKFAWYKPMTGCCANGRHDSLAALQSASKKFIEDSRYEIYSIDDYDLQLVPKAGK